MPKFTVYLIKEGFAHCDRYLKSENTNSIFDKSVMIGYDSQLYSYIKDKDMNPKVIERSGRSNAYYRNRDEKTPWWKKFWNIPDDITTKSADLLVVKELNNRIFIITHGQSRYYINPFSIEYDFGLKSALNVLDRNKIKSTDLFTPSELAIRTKLQTGKDAEISDLDIDIFKTLMKNISGKVKAEYEELFKTIEGADSIKFNFSESEAQLDDLLCNLLQIYELNSYQESGFDWIDYFRPVKDKATLAVLFESLFAEINTRNQYIILTYPTHFDNIRNIYFKYTGLKPDSLFPTIEINQYYNYLDKSSIESITLEQIKNDQRQLKIPAGKSNCR